MYADVMPSRGTLEAHWANMQAVLQDVACRHFAMRPHQKCANRLPATFDVLWDSRTAQQHWLAHVDAWHGRSIRFPLRWFFDAFRLFARRERLLTAAKQAVKADEKAWFCSKPRT